MARNATVRETSSMPNHRQLTGLPTGPGEIGQRIHRDQWKYDMVDFDVEVELNGMWAVTDFSEANGATRVAPGSHLWGNREKVDRSETIRWLCEGRQRPRLLA